MDYDYYSPIVTGARRIVNMQKRRVYAPMADAQNICPSWYCPSCGAEQYENDPVIVEDGERLCLECFRSKVIGLLDSNPEIVAGFFGARYLEGAVEL